MINKEDKIKWMSDRIGEGNTVKYHKDASTGLECIETGEIFYFNWGSQNVFKISRK